MADNRHIIPNCVDGCLFVGPSFGKILARSQSHSLDRFLPLRQRLEPFFLGAFKAQKIKESRQSLNILLPGRWRL